MNWSRVPKHLRPLSHWPEDTKRRINSIAKDYPFEDDTAGLIMLQQLGNADAAETEYREIVEKEGAMVVDRFDQKKAHPLIAAIRDCRSQKLQALKALNLEDGTPARKPGRPPGPGKQYAHLLR